MPLTDLATTADLEARTTDALPSTAAAILTDVSARLRSYMGQDITTGESTVVLRRDGCKLRLPQRPVTAVTAVVLPLDDSPIPYAWDGVSDELDLYAPGPAFDPFSGAPLPSGAPTVKVTYTHGFTEVPPDLLAVVCQVTLRALGRPGTEAGITQETIAGYSVQIGSAAGAGPLGLLKDEREVLDGYRRRGVGSIRLGIR